MAVHAITGVMGSGKSYEAVSEKIVPALKNEADRRVVTNIEGLNTAEIAKYIGKPEAEVEVRLVRISYERVSEAGFWYDPESGAIETVVQPGDLVVLDEVWRYFNRTDKLPADAMKFFRMHRHYVGTDSGLTCDVVLINQSFRGIHSDIRDVVETQFACRKLKALGRPQNYQVSVIEGGERKATRSELRKYSDKVFPLYSSYSGTQGKEAYDKRQSVFNTPLFKYVLPLFAVLMCWGVWSTMNYFTGMGKAKGGELAAASTIAPAKPTTASPGTPAPTGQGQVAPAAQPTPGGFQQPAPGTAETWRVAARYTVNGLPVVVLVDSAGRHRTVTAGLLAPTEN
jgi:zona occludens toxin